MFFYQRFNQYFAQVAGGLEDIAATELKALGATDGEILTRGIHFKADRETLYRINYWSSSKPKRPRNFTWEPRRSTGRASSGLTRPSPCSPTPFTARSITASTPR